MMAAWASGWTFPPRTRGWTVADRAPDSGAQVSPAHAGMDLSRAIIAEHRGSFPAHAGMDRPGALRGRTSRSFPRTRGDGPLLWSNIQTLQPFPPHTRGWTLILLHPGAHLFVSPAHAGMDRTRGRRTRGPHRFPRTRGDGPAASPRIALRLMFPPHTRGWTAGAHARAVRRRVSPAHAGMDRGASWCTGSLGCFPRTRGDGPLQYLIEAAGAGFPPHTRGWTLRMRCARDPCDVSPAHAGMDRTRGRRTRGPHRFPRTRGDGPAAGYVAGARCFPRTRGDGPRLGDDGKPAHPFPPHTRGWTLAALELRRCFPRTRGDGPDESLMLNSDVSPAHAGMVRKMMAAWRRGGRFPRTRGDGPDCAIIAVALVTVPPHTRGWTDDVVRKPLPELVSPAHAGMDLEVRAGKGWLRPLRSPGRPRSGGVRGRGARPPSLLPVRPESRATRRTYGGRQLLGSVEGTRTRRGR